MTYESIAAAWYLVIVAVTFVSVLLMAVLERYTYVWYNKTDFKQFLAIICFLGLVPMLNLAIAAFAAVWTIVWFMHTLATIILGE